MHLNEFARKYCEQRTILSYARGTVKAELFFLNRFFKHLGEINIAELAAVTRDVVRDYQTRLYEEINVRGEPNGVAYQNNNLRAVKSFFRFLKENDYLPGDPAKDLSYARTPKRLPRSILSGPEAKKIIHAPDTRTLLGYRDRAVLEVLYSTGIRREEVINLLLPDVDYQDGFVRVNSGKGNKDRVVPLGKIACRYLENYVKAVRPELARDPCNNHLFLSMKGNRLSKTAVWELVKRYGKKTRIKKNISPHTFRHTCATLMLRNKANIRHIQELLGHSSLESTQVYAQVSIMDLKEVHSKCHPREKDRE